MKFFFLQKDRQLKRVQYGVSDILMEVLNTVFIFLKIDMPIFIYALFIYLLIYNKVQHDAELTCQKIFYFK